LFAILFITGLGFLLTFSRSAFLGLFIGFLIFAWQIKKDHCIPSPFFKGGLRGILKSQYSKNPSPTPPASSCEASRAGFPLRKGESRKHLTLFLYFIALLIFTLFLIKSTSLFSNQSLQERNLYQNVSYETFLKHPLAGVGIGQFVMSEYQNHPNLESWQYQPVHNIYLFVFSELGIVGLIFFLLWIFSISEWGGGKNRNTDLLRSLLLTRLSICCIISSFLFIAFFDHYFWDIKLGTTIFALPFVFIFALVAYSKRYSTDNQSLL